MTNDCSAQWIVDNNTVHVLLENKAESMDYTETIVRHRRSSVTASGAPAVEPYLSYIPVLQHESLWLDSALIPASEANDIRTLMVLSNGAHIVDTSDHNVYYDSSGNSVAGTVVDGVRVSAVRKVVRHELSTGSYGEVSSSTLDLRRLVPAGFSLDSTLLYTPVLEVLSGEEYVPIADHIWSFDPAAGVFASTEGNVLPTNASSIYLTAYEYVGRVGLSVRQLDPVTDDVHEGVANMYYTHERFLDSLGTVTLDDVPNSATRRVVDAASMLSLGLSIGDAPELRFRPLVSAPSATASTLYVQRIEGNDTLYFGETPVGALSTGHNAQYLSTPDLATLGRFEGEFAGSTEGVHTGDVVGNVQGLVSSLDNHRVIEAKLVGSGEGHWCGTVNGDVVGSFEGDAKISRGSIESAYHVVIGTYESTALLRVHGSSSHVMLSHLSGGAALIECAPDGTLSLDNSLSASDIVCANVSVGGSLHVANVYCDRVDSAGIWNHMYGMYDVGPVEDVTLLSAENIVATALSAGTLVTGAMTSDFLSVASFFASSFFLDSVAYDNLSVATIIATQLSVATLLVNNQLVIDEISVGTLFGYEADAGDTEELSVGFLVAAALSAGSTLMTSLSTGELHVPGTCSATSATITALSASTVSALSVAAVQADVAALSVASLHVVAVDGSLSAGIGTLVSLSIGQAVASSVSAGQVDATALSVAALHVVGVDGSLSANFASIDAALDAKHPLTTVDSAASLGSNALITSSAVYNAVSASALLQQPLLVPGVEQGSLPVQLTADANPALSIAGGIDLHTQVELESGEDVYMTMLRANAARVGQFVDFEFRSVHGGATRESFTVKPGEDNAFNMQIGASTWSASSHSNRRFESVHVFGKEHIRLFTDELHLQNADGSAYSGALQTGVLTLLTSQSISAGNTNAASGGDVFAYLSANYQPSITSATVLVADSLALSSALSVAGATVLLDGLSVAVDVTTGGLSTASGVADSLSVGSMYVGVMLGSGLDQEIIDTYYSVGDTTHNGNMLIDGNLLVTGAVLTGTHNRLINDLHAFEIGGALSVGSLIVETSCVSDAISVSDLTVGNSVTSTTMSVASLAIGAFVSLPSNVQYVAQRHSYHNVLTAAASASYDNAEPFVTIVLGASGGFGTWSLGKSFRTVQQVGYDEHTGDGAFSPAAEFGSRFFRIRCSITAALVGSETVRLEILKNGAPIGAARLPSSDSTTTVHTMDFLNGATDVITFRLHNDRLASDPWALTLDHNESFLCSMDWEMQ